MLILLRVLYEPKKVFRQIQEGQPFYPALLITMAADLILALFLRRYVMDVMAAQLEGMQTAGGSFMIQVVSFTILLTALMNALISLAAALVLMIATLVFGGYAGYRDIFGVLVVGSAPSLVGRILRIGAYLLGITPDPRVSLTSLGGLIPASQDTLWLQMAASIDLFDLWSFVLIVIGFAQICSLSRGRAYAVAAAAWGSIQGLLLRMSVTGGGTN